MNVNQENINLLLNSYVMFVDNLCKKNEYHSNIKHLLYLIVPAFIVKYGNKHERIILKCFEETKVIITSNNNKNMPAYFTRTLKTKIIDGYEQYYSEKYIIINNFYNAQYFDMIDTVIHELNHSINSMNNEILYDDKHIKLRTGLSYINYLKNDLSNAIEKDKSAILEEIINTKQTEEILNIIISFSNFNIDNIEINNSVNTLKREIGNRLYKSDAYFLQSYVCKELMKNKTFISTIENLRITGNVDNITDWFNNIVNKENAYQRMIELLDQLFQLEKKCNSSKWFRNFKIKNIRAKCNCVLEIVRLFEQSSVYK